MKVDPKLTKLHDHMQLGEWEKAIKIAASLHDLGEEREKIKSAHSAITNQNFYKQLGKDIDQIIQSGIDAIKRKFSNYEEHKREAFNQQKRVAQGWIESSESDRKELIKTRAKSEIINLQRKRLKSMTGKADFEYFGTVLTGTDIYFGTYLRNKKNVSKEQYNALLRTFSGKTVSIEDLGNLIDHDNLHSWLKENVSNIDITLFVVKILIEEGYATRDSKNQQLIIINKILN